jgi:hypothetical protein
MGHGSQERGRKAANLLLVLLHSLQRIGFKLNKSPKQHHPLRAFSTSKRSEERQHEEFIHVAFERLQDWAFTKEFALVRDSCKTDGIERLEDRGWRGEGKGCRGRQRLERRRSERRGRREEIDL